MGRVHAVQLNVQYTLVPTSYPSQPLTGTPYPSDPPPNITDSICRYSGNSAAFSQLSHDAQ